MKLSFLVKNRLQDIFPLVYLALAFKNYFILKLLEKIEAAHIYYKELVTDKENIFTANISQNNEAENKRFSKSHEYGVNGMAIKPDIGSYSLIKVSDKQKLKEISEKNSRFSKKNKELKTDLKVSNPETNPEIQRFYNTITKKMKPNYHL